MFVNLVDKKKEQGALGEAFDDALEALADGAGSDINPPTEADEKKTSGRSSAKGGAVGVGGQGLDLGGSLRHVWFDFHHEVGFALAPYSIRSGGEGGRERLTSGICGGIGALMRTTSAGAYFGQGCSLWPVLRRAVRVRASENTFCSSGHVLRRGGSSRGARSGGASGRRFETA